MYYLSKRWFILLVISTIGTAAISGYLCGHEIGVQRHYQSYQNLEGYAILLENENNRLNQVLKGQKKCQNLKEN